MRLMTSPFSDGEFQNNYIDKYCANMSQQNEKQRGRPGLTNHMRLIQSSLLRSLLDFSGPRYAPEKRFMEPKNWLVGG